MKVVNQTAHSLSLGTKDTVIERLFFVVIAAIGLLLILGALFVGNATTLTCSSNSALSATANFGDKQNFVTCTLIKSNLLGQERSKKLISRLQEAHTYTAKYYRSAGYYKYTIYELTLLTEIGNIFFSSSEYYTIQQFKVSQINTFVNHPSMNPLKLEGDGHAGNYAALVVGSICIIVGLLMVVVIPSKSVCTFDKTMNSMTLEHSTANVIQQTLSDIIDVLVEEWEDTYRVSLILACGESLPLTHIYSSGRKEKQQVASCIQEFLGLSRAKPED